MLFEVLIVGCGNIAGGFDEAGRASSQPLTHAGAFSIHPGFQLAGCIEPDADRRKNFAENWKIATAAQSFDVLAAAPGSFDVISICSPTEFHDAHLAAAVLLKPKLIFCEKPLTASLTQSERAVRICQSAGIELVVNYNRQWDPTVKKIKSDLDIGRWGTIRSVVSHYNKGILNNGSHMIDLLIQIFGPLNLISAPMGWYDYFEEDPTIAALLQSERGIPIYLNPTNAVDYSYFEVEIICSRAVIRMLSGGLKWQVREIAPSPIFEGYQTLGKTVDSNGALLEAMTFAVDEIYAHLAQGSAMSSSAGAALEVQKLCENIRDLFLNEITQ